jgi:hypothetical protein
MAPDSSNPDHEENLMGHHATTLDEFGAIGLFCWAVLMWAAVGFLAYAGRRSVARWQYRAAGTVVLIGVLGQVGHLQEHVAQVGYWVQHPEQPGWMTPWGTGLATGFDGVLHRKPPLGMEILHLTGNFVFLAGLAGVLVITRNARHTKACKWGRMGAIMQTLHGMEHVALTLSVWFGAKRAIGLSTWFGLMAPGPGLWTYRIWWHFIANVLGSVIFAVAVYYLWCERDEIQASFGPTAPPSPGEGAPHPVVVDWSADAPVHDAEPALA